MSLMVTGDDQKFLQRISSSLNSVQDWDSDIEVLKACRSKIPWEELRDPIGKYSEDTDRLLDSSNAIFVQRLSRWFKQDYMTWVNNPPCDNCGNKSTECKNVRGPESDEEKEGGASRVEVYFCPQCNGNTTTFPRYNKCKKLLETRKGRCGEYANLFGCICRSVGLETRYVLDFSDHVWTEVCLKENTWIMVDSCEGVINKPSMYEFGWGKGPKLSYMIGIAIDHVVDVTPRYTRNFMTEDFQNRRRQFTSSEDSSAHLVKQLNDKVQAPLTSKQRDELLRRQKLESYELNLCKQSTEWTEQEKHGCRGRISGSLAWKQSRLESGKSEIKAGTSNDENGIKPQEEVATFEIESFYPPIPSTTVSIQLYPKPMKHHDAIRVASTSCAIGEPNAVSVVVIDEVHLGCILQSKSFASSWDDIANFIDRLPSNRIVIMSGLLKKKEGSEEKDASQKKISIPRLGGWNGCSDDIDSKGILYIGQVDSNPDWTYFSTLDSVTAKNGYEIELLTSSTTRSSSIRLRTEKQFVPSVVAGRLPESIMPLKTQLLASEQQKRMAFISFCSGSKDNKSRYCGYTTKPNSPVYLLDSMSYPLSRMSTAVSSEAGSRDDGWNTFHFLPSPLVPEDDNGMVTNDNKSSFIVPNYDVPLDLAFFNRTLGGQILGQNNATLPCRDALQNARLIGLYFSASWCGPCRQFTPMLAEMYAHLKEERPSHGLEIVFVSSDRDANSFQSYFDKMPWQAIPFGNLALVKQNLSMMYGIRGIPALVVLDAVSGQVVVSAAESRQEVAASCRGGEASIEAMLDSWLGRTPQESREILNMLELSCQDVAEDNSSKKLVESAENPYLVISLGQKKQPKSFDLAAEVKTIFERLVAKGSDPTAAAAKAITLATNEQRKEPKLEPGLLNGKAARTGSPINVEALDEAFANAMVWNETSAVSALLSTTSKYVKNVIKEPWTSKFRSFKLSNKAADQINRVEGGLKVVQCLGFEVFAASQDFKAAIPVGVDLEDMHATIERLFEDIADA